MTYLRNAWYVAELSRAVVADKPTSACILGQPIVLWRNEAGELTGLDDRCLHRLAPLSLGRCEGINLRCMYHGWLYDRGGRVVEIPGQERVPNSLRLRTYPVCERHGWIWVWMGDAAWGEDLIPPVVGLDNQDYVTLGDGQLEFAVEARLVNENLLDLSHISFLHANSNQLSEVWARKPPRFTKQERGVLTEWWIRGEPRGAGPNAAELVDTYSRTEFYAPGVLFVTDRFYPAGTADRLGGAEPDLKDPPYLAITHAVTPTSDRSTRYFFAVAAHQRFKEEAIPTADALLDMVRQAFAEDKVMIESQQRNIDKTPGYRFIPSGNDRGVIMYNEILQSLITGELAPAV